MKIQSDVNSQWSQKKNLNIDDRRKHAESFETWRDFFPCRQKQQHVHTHKKSGTPIFFCSDKFEFLRIEPVAHPMQKYKSTQTAVQMYYVGIVYPAALSL